jgi:hypothetical protein
VRDREPTVTAPIGGDGAGERGDRTDGPPVASAEPPRAARLLAFAAILVAGACGGLIGAAVADLQCTGDCGTPTALGALAGAIAAALGVAVVAVLVLRAMGEWRTIQLENRSRRNPSA